MAFSFVSTATTSQTILLSSRKEPPPKHTNRHLSHQLNSTATQSNLKTKRQFKQNREDVHITRRIISFVGSGRMEEALKLFDSVKKPILFHWNIIIRGYAKTELYEEAIQFNYRMQSSGVRADKFTFPPLIKSCTGLAAIDEGLKAHARLIKTGLCSDLFVCNSLITMYSKLGLITDAQKVFDTMPVRDLISWNSLIDGFVLNGHETKALSFFREFSNSVGEKHENCSVMSALAACAMKISSKSGREIHCYAIKHGFIKDVKVTTSILDMYCKCGQMSRAQKVFDEMSVRTLTTWNSLIGGYSINKLHDKAAFCLVLMLGENMEPNSVTILNLLTSCAQSESISLGKSIHAYCIKRCLIPHLRLEATLNDMYGKCGDLRSAQQLFDRMVEKNLVSWNTILGAYVKKEKYEEAISLFIELLNEPLKPDLFIMANVVPAYAELALLRHGQQIHSYVVRLGYTDQIIVMNSIVYMYARCGDMKRSRQVFDRMSKRDVITWNTILMGYGIHGFGNEALDLFSCMKIIGVRPNVSTFVSVLTACSVSGLADQGWILFKVMQDDYGIVPHAKHYGCMVDLLGRKGDLNEALKFIESMPLAPSASIWGSLLTASRNRNNLEIAELAAERISKLEHDNTGCYVLLCSMYVDAGRWDDVARVRNIMREKGLRKTVAKSLVELPTKTRTFVNGDMSHAESQIINETSDVLSRKIGEKMDRFNNVFDPTYVGAKKAILANRHSVRLAVVFSLISSAIGTPVFVKKNMRICNVCHDALKKISKYTKREIVVGDSSIYHHFSQGVCCCGDYW